MAQNKNGTTRGRMMSRPTSDPAKTTEPPPNLDPDATIFWVKHAETLAAADMLTDQDTDAFLLLCQLYSLCLRQHKLVMSGQEPARSYTDLLYRFTQMAKQFGLLPAERRRIAVTFKDNHSQCDDKELFDL